MRNPLVTVMGLSLAGLLLAGVQKKATMPDPRLVQDMEKEVGCPVEGTYKNGKPAKGEDRDLNLQKNRFGFPNKFDGRVELRYMIYPGLDATRWDADQDIPVRIKGYVAFIIQNFEGESCNCFKHDDAHSDTHIDLVLDPKDARDFTKHVIVEITPRMKFLAKKRGLDWSSHALQRDYTNKWVQVEGWLFWDSGHIMQAQNTHPDNPNHKNWRATCWEVHPVTSIKLAGKG